MPVSALLLGFINIAIVVAVLILIGVVCRWICEWMAISLPPLATRIYMVIVALIALYMLVQLLLGVTPALHLVR